MSKNLFDLRFSIKREDGYISGIWRLWITKHGDVYLTTRSMGGIHKYSFHTSGICRHAFTKEYGASPSMNDRAIFKWMRQQTPSDPKQASRVAWMAFPTDYLSKNFESITTSVTWIEAAPRGGATYLELYYIAVTSQRQINIGGRSLLGSQVLPSDELFVASYYHADWENKDINSPTTQGSAFKNLVFSANDPDNTGRPIRMTYGPRPKDGEALIVTELGGYETQ